MRTVIQATLTGIQKSKGDGVIEGKQVSWDYTKFHLMSTLPSKGDNAKGEATQEYRFGESQEFDKWKTVSLPCVVDVEMFMTTNGKGAQAVEVQSIKPAKEQPRKAA
jgi:hypothetical protein